MNLELSLMCQDSGKLAVMTGQILEIDYHYMSNCNYSERE